MVLSFHDFQDGSMKRLPKELARQPNDILKVAAFVSDASDLMDLLDFPSFHQPMIKIGMGPAGMLTRALYGRFGSLWTYLVEDHTPAVAPGQLTLSRAKRWRVRSADQLSPLGLIGGEQVVHSPGPLVYNRLFAEQSLPYIYLPVVTTKPLQTLELVERLGFAGCSVTMPAKQQLAPLMTRRIGIAERLKTINTILWKDETRIGYNTDVPAIQSLLSEHAGRRALILGAGGAAMAAAAALKELACPMTITSLVDEETQSLVSSFPGSRGISWEDRENEPFELLINATPCGADGRSNPMPSRTDWSDLVVLDAVLLSSTPLLERVKEGGGEGMGGWSWWYRQGALQMKLMIKAPFTEHEMKETHLNAKRSSTNDK
jgi:shikimate 5-dehydrogenase